MRFGITTTLFLCLVSLARGSENEVKVVEIQALIYLSNTLFEQFGLIESAKPWCFVECAGGEETQVVTASLTDRHREIRHGA